MRTRLRHISIGSMEAEESILYKAVKFNERRASDGLSEPATYLESLPDEVFFAKRFKLSKEDEALLMKNSSIVHGKRFYRARVKEPIMAKYAAMTNPKEGEPGSKSNPMIRFGKKYVYNQNGDLVPFRGDVRVIVSPNLSEEQKKMVREAAKMPIVYEPDCPKSSIERLQRFREYGAKRQGVL